MCAECGMNPCHPRCPNAPEPVPVHECVKCGYGILVGDKFWDSPEGKICEECVDDMSAEEIRYSHDMSEVKTYGIEKQDTEEGVTE